MEQRCLAFGAKDGGGRERERMVNELLEIMVYKKMFNLMKSDKIHRSHLN